MKKTLLFLFVLFFISETVFSYPSEVFPSKISSGDTVTIKFNKSRIDQIEVVSPTGKVFKFNTKSIDGRKLYFDKTTEKGFLKTNWNEYKVRFLKNKKCIDSAFFYLTKKSKTLYLTVYIDDVGRDGFLFEPGEKWYKSIGGILNYGYQNDDEGGIPLKKLLTHYNNDYYKNDFIFHHFTSAEFEGNRLLWSIYHIVKWEFLKLDIDNFVGFKVRDRYYLVFALLLLLVSVFYFYRNKKYKWYFTGFSFLLLVLLSVIIYSEKYVQDESKWVFKFHDFEWNKNALLQFKSEFENENLMYPPVTRHTWNLPPYGMNKFYLSEMGVIADASFIFPNKGKFANKKESGIVLTKIKEYEYDWPEELKLPLPYYTNINEELNSIWNGKEEERGLLEMPLTIDDLSAFPFNNFDKAIIDSLPNGALVSTYIHPKTDLRCIKDLVEHLENNYTIIHTSAHKYADLYHKHFPRAVIFDSETKKTYWAQLSNTEINLITETDIFNPKGVRNDISHKLISITDTSTFAPDVIMFRDTDEVFQLNGFCMPPYIAVAGDKNDEVILNSSYEFHSTLNDEIKLYKYIN